MGNKPYADLMDNLRRQRYGDVLPEASPVYKRIIENARFKERTHHQRRGMKLRKFFADHPECYQPPLPGFIDGELVRDGNEQIIRMTEPDKRINIDFRMGAGWFDRVTDDSRIGLPQYRCGEFGSKWIGLEIEDEETVSEMERSSKQLSFDW